MILKNKFSIIVVMLGFFSCGCMNTTVPQFSKTVERAKLNNTLIKGYVSNLIPDSSHIQIGQAWVEKVWYYEKLGNKSVSDDKCLYIEFINNYYWDKMKYKNIILQEEVEDLPLFEGYIGYRISGERIWCELTFKKKHHIYS